ncbi:hypothetical protein BU23DRAFT_307153 [Bimuria novae-zelandiae CBS 107.79]|uniref:Uncharacterized protein n=1 Tax=Bimuria novae-zelandiae CBS 107.79 TaxID=1447943 RepID=A0A6A5UQG3_9PLEO|nr:hypothetical protein BU23DRAFT_307153 [Bimuria novae-zelandiae CBS 107.79]
MERRYGGRSACMIKTTVMASYAPAQRKSLASSKTTEHRPTITLTEYRRGRLAGVPGRCTETVVSCQGSLRYSWSSTFKGFPRSHILIVIAELLFAGSNAQQGAVRALAVGGQRDPQNCKSLERTASEWSGDLPRSCCPAPMLIEACSKFIFTLNFAYSVRAITAPP